MIFRELAKEKVNVTLPPEIATAIRVMAAQNRRSMAATVTELVCAAINQDPQEYGISPTIRRPRRTREATPA